MNAVTLQDANVLNKTSVMIDARDTSVELTKLHNSTYSICANTTNIDAEPQNPDSNLDGNKSKTIYGNSGIINVGNTCYMNATIQTISHTYYLRRYLLEHEEELIILLLTNAKKIVPEMINLINFPGLKEKIEASTYDKNLLSTEEQTVILNSTMTYQMIKILKGLWSDNCVVNPVSFRRVFVEFRKKFFFGHAQHDSQEAYTCIIQKMDEELGVKTNIIFRSNNKSMETLLNFKTLIQKKMDMATSQEAKQSYLDEYFKKKEEMPIEAIILESYKERKKILEPSYSKISDIFIGFEHTEVICTSLNCGYVRHKFDSYYQITLKLGNANDLATHSHHANGVTNSVIDYIRNFYTSEILDEKNSWKCDRCKKLVRAQVNHYLWTSPVVLVIHFGRFVYDAVHRGKDTRYIDFPLKNLDISSVVSDINKDTVSKCYTYNLYSVINHTGSMGGGHYYTYALNEQSGNWYVYDDSKISKIESTQIVNQHAYMLFYVRCDML